MEAIKKELCTLETVELQLLGSLHKLQSGNKEGLRDVETIARRVKASCKSLRAKIEVVEIEVVETDMKKQRKTAMELNALNSKLQSELDNSKSFLQDESWVEIESEPEQK